MDFGFSFEDVLMAKPVLEVQVTILLLQAVTWYFCIPFIGKKIKAFIDQKPYRKQFIDLSAKSWEGAFKMKFSDPEIAFEFSCLFAGIIVQHIVGGALCIPSVYGFPGISTTTAFALARHGALCEAGWELQDGLERMYTVLVKKDWSMNHPEYLKMVASHHAMGLSIVIPMNMFYGDFILYHKGIFFMQGVAAAAMTFQYYAFTLNLNKRSDMIQMRTIVIANLVALVYCRILGFGGIALEMIPILYNDNLFFLGICLVVTILMQYINYTFIMEALRKVRKYMSMPLPPSKSQKQQDAKISTQTVRKLKRVVSDIVLKGDQHVKSA